MKKKRRTKATKIKQENNNSSPLLLAYPLIAMTLLFIICFIRLNNDTNESVDKDELSTTSSSTTEYIAEEKTESITETEADETKDYDLYFRRSASNNWIIYYCVDFYTNTQLDISVRYKKGSTDIRSVEKSITDITGDLKNGWSDETYEFKYDDSGDTPRVYMYINEKEYDDCYVMDEEIGKSFLDKWEEY